MSISAIRGSLSELIVTQIYSICVLLNKPSVECASNVLVPFFTFFPLDFLAELCEA